MTWLQFTQEHSMVRDGRGDGMKRKAEEKGERGRTEVHLSLITPSNTSKKCCKALQELSSFPLSLSLPQRAREKLWEDLLG